MWVGTFTLCPHCLMFFSHYIHLNVHIIFICVVTSCSCSVVLFLVGLHLALCMSSDNICICIYYCICISLSLSLWIHIYIYIDSYLSLRVYIWFRCVYKPGEVFPAAACICFLRRLRFCDTLICNKLSKVLPAAAGEFCSTIWYAVSLVRFSGRRRHLFFGSTNAFLAVLTCTKLGEVFPADAGKHPSFGKTFLWFVDMH